MMSCCILPLFVRFNIKNFHKRINFNLGIILSKLISSTSLYEETIFNWSMVSLWFFFIPVINFTFFLSIINLFTFSLFTLFTFFTFFFLFFLIFILRTIRLCVLFRISITGFNNSLISRGCCSNRSLF